jgi:aryl-alcohol dehydrogenase-like predicted oxidoreductase
VQTRSIGPLEVSLVGLGCNNFGRRIDADATRAVVDTALGAGITLFDTADVYGGDGRSEELLGAALRGRRDEAVIATKFGMRLDDERQGAHPAYVRQACEDSLRRLDVDHLDLYQLHRPDPDVPIEETLGALGELVQAGKVRVVGHSNLSAREMDEAEGAAATCAVPRFECAQDRWNLLERDLEEETLPAIERNGLALLPYFPLASGLLTGKYRAGEEPDPGWRLATLPAERREAQLAADRLETVERLRSFAEARGHTLLELAFSWLVAHPVVASVIAGATRPEQVEANATAVGWDLSDDELAELDQLTVAQRQAS